MARGPCESSNGKSLEVNLALSIDAGHSAGVDRVGLMTPKVLAGR
jgi:hypothetical protein